MSSTAQRMSLDGFIADPKREGSSLITLRMQSPSAASPSSTATSPRRSGSASTLSTLSTRSSRPRSARRSSGAA